MTGRILGLASRHGTIKAADGSRLLFPATAVLGDFDALAIGQNVAFEVEFDGARRRVTKVFREPGRLPVPRKGMDAAPDLRYVDFRQSANVRTYRFEDVTPGPSIQHSITLDTNLLLKHHVGMQEVLVLCVHKIGADLKTSPQAVSHQLGEDEVRRFADCRAAAIERKRSKHPFTGRRGAPPPGPVPRRVP